MGAYRIGSRVESYFYAHGSLQIWGAHEVPLVSRNHDPDAVLQLHQRLLAPILPGSCPECGTLASAAPAYMRFL